MALLGKWMWRFKHERESLWVRVLVSKYGDIRGGGYESLARGRLGKFSGWWREVVKITVGPDGGWFNKGLVRVVGGGSNTLFWEDVWVGNESLRTKFPGLYELSLEKEGMVDKMGIWCGGYWVWDWKWSRDLSDIELNLLGSLINVLNRFAPCVGVQDSWKWRTSPSGRYNTKEAYDVLSARNEVEQLSEDLEDGFNIIWNTLAPLKATGHAWRLLWDRLPTKSNLIRRNIPLSQDESRCAICSGTDETAKHLFFECSRMYAVWMEFYQWLGISTAVNSNTVQNLLFFVKSFKGKRGKKIASSIWIGVVWLIWKWRNEVIFGGETFSSIKLVEDLKIRTWSWLSVKDNLSSRFSYMDWLANPRMIIESSL